MPERFTEQMARRSDSDLIRIVYEQRSDYLPEALVAAETELNRRGLDADAIQKAKVVLETEAKTESWKAALPLDIPIRILTMLFPGLLTVILAGTYKADGYDRKSDELIRWTLYGFAMYFLIVMIVVVLL